MNVLVIDDDVKISERLMGNLRRADHAGVLGIIKVDDTVIKLDSVEEYDISQYDVKYDVALIDYQLSTTFTGILVSAWIALHLKIPRLTLTSAAYPGDPAYFNGSILKNEIVDTPQEVIRRIVECVENYEADVWLSNQHQELVAEYQRLLKCDGVLDRQYLVQVEGLLDRFERILDVHQEEHIKKVSMHEKEQDSFKKRQRENEEKLAELYRKYDMYLEAIKNG